LQSADVWTVTWLELGGGWVFLTALAPFARSGGPFVLPSRQDVMLLAILAGVCTLFPTAAYLAALRHLSAFGIQLSINLEPVYSIVLAVLLLGEQHELGGRFYAGVAIIIGGVFGHSLATRARRSGAIDPQRLSNERTDPQ
jgi:drug/metabolite transporter (DMT)-like permease